ncbi:MAG: tetratricopeptide repeat protein [Croceivirga sp.]
MKIPSPNLKIRLLLIIVWSPLFGKAQTNPFSEDSTAYYSQRFDSVVTKNPETALVLLKRLKAYAEQHSDSYALSEYQLQKGRYFLDKGITDSARYHFNQARDGFQIKDSIFKVNITNYHIARLENLKANYPEAQRLISNGIDVATSSRKDSLLLLRYINLNATVYSNLDNQKRSIEEGLKALDLAVAMKDKPLEAAALKALGSSYHYASNHLRALEYKKKALTAYEAINDMPMVGVMLNNIGNGVSVMGDEQGAVPYFKRSLAISEKYKNNNMVAITSFCLGRSYVRLGEPQKGVPYFEKSLHISKNITKAPKTEMWALNGLANAYNKLDKPKNAIPLLDRTIKISDSINRKADKAVAYDYRSKSYEHIGQWEKSLADARMFKIVSDSIAELERLEEIERLTVIYETEKKEAEIALQEEEINTLNEKVRADNLQKGLYAGGMASALALFGLSVFGYRQRIKKNRIAREKQEEIYKKEIEHKQKELASQTLHLVQKNTFIHELKENLIHLKNSPEKFKAEFRRIVMLLKKENASDKDWEVFKTYFADVHNDFDQKLKTLYTNISEKEIRLAAFLRMNLTTKEIAATMNVLPDSILKSKYRLKKKLGLDKQTDLNQFLNAL